MSDVGTDHSHVPTDAESFRCARRCVLCAKSEQGSNKVIFRCLEWRCAHVCSRQSSFIALSAAGLSA